MKHWFGILLFSHIACIQAQTNTDFEFGKNQFYAFPTMQLLACQIDGDAASGYNKIGYNVAFHTGMGLSPTRAVEFSIGITERGSRRAFNEEQPSLTPFHIRYNALEVGLFYVAIWNGKQFYGGIKPAYQLNVRETEGYSPYINVDYAKIAVLSELGFRMKVAANWSINATLNYSVFTLLKEGGSNNIVFPTGVYHNTLAFGVAYNP